VTARLVRRILIGAAREGLDVAGVAVVGPAWPVLRGALAPVLDRLAEKLGGEDPLSSVETAGKAADAFEQDQRLEELLRSNLITALEPISAGQQRLDAGFQTLYEVVTENSERLEDIDQKLGSIDSRMTAGVRLDEDTVERLAQAAAERVAVVLEIRGFAQREAAGADAAGSEPWLTREQLVTDSNAVIARANRAEVEAVEQIGEGQLVRAAEWLERERVTVALALAETPSDVALRLQYGYILKGLGQATAAAGDEAAADGWLTRAETMFELALRDVPKDSVDRGDLASAANGLANILAERGRHAAAVRLYREAVRLEPTYGYAWHDLFGSLLALASQGDIRRDDLDDAWKGLLASAPGYPGLEPETLEELRTHYERWRA
jgi:tetratricopeptide (TPR) repeat protein